MDWYIGLDIGTTNIKAMAFCPNSGAPGSLTNLPTPVAKDSSQSHTFDVEALFQTALRALGGLRSRIDMSQVRAIAVSSMGESGVFADAGGHPLCNAITWFDSRSKPQAEALAEALGQEEIYRITGQICSSKFGITKLMWEREHHPELYASAARWLSVNDYILFRLSGQFYCDYSIASRTMAFDIHRLDWSPTILDALKLPRSLFAEPVPGGTAIGHIRAEIAQQLGLRPDVQIVTGGHDHACAAVGSGTLQPGTILDSLGTSEVAVLPVQHAPVTHEMFLAQASVYPHCSETLYRVLTSMQACGASLNWFLDTIGADIARRARDEQRSPHELLQEIAASCAESPGLQYYPFLRGSLAQPAAGGAFLDFHDHHSLPHFAKALIDGLCCEFTYQLQELSRVLGRQYDTICAVGGPSRGRYFMERKAGISGMTIHVPGRQECACFGAVLLAAIGHGNLRFDEIANIVADPQDTVYTPEASPVPGELYSLYRKRREHICNCFD